MLEKLLGSEFTRVMSFMKPRIWRYASGMLLMTALFTGLSVVEAFALKYIMNAAIDRQMSSFIQGILVMLVGSLIVIILVPVFRWWYNGCAVLTAAEIRRLVFDRITQLPISYFEGSHSGQAIARMTNDTNLMVDIYNFKLRRFVAPTINAIVAGAAMLSLDWRIASVLILFNFGAVYINARFARPIRRVSDEIQRNMGTMTERLIDLLAGFSIIKLYHLESRMIDSYEQVNREATDLSIRRRGIEGMLDSTNFALSMVSNLGMVVVGTWLVTSRITDFGNLLALINLQASLNRALLQAGSYLPQVQESLAGAHRVFELLDAPAEPERYALTPPGPNPADIELKDVTFSYEQREKALDGLNLSVKRGQVVALVGPSGGGKSTVVKILMGFYCPQQGSIGVAGRSLSDYALGQLRDLIAYVPQDAYLFDGTIEENIRYGRIDASAEEVHAAARAAYAHDFIMEQPKGYQTVVGERGTKLSGGQRQRIAIARALLKNAPILLLDEATSSLDSESEQLVQRALDVLMRDRTTIVIAHRLSTVQNADMICVVEDGKVVEQGKHHELMEQEGSYWRLHETQFKTLASAN